MSVQAWHLLELLEWKHYLRQENGPTRYDTNLVIPTSARNLFGGGRHPRRPGRRCDPLLPRDRPERGRTPAIGPDVAAGAGRGDTRSPLRPELRCLRPLGPNKTLSEIWHFRLKGAPEAIYQRSLWYYNLVNSPSTMVNADDLENWNRIQRGLQAEEMEWLSFHRNYGQDTIDGDVIRTREGLSEAPLRNQFRAWRKFMTDEVA